MPTKEQAPKTAATPKTVITAYQKQLERLETYAGVVGPAIFLGDHAQRVQKEIQALKGHLANADLDIKHITTRANILWVFIYKDWYEASKKSVFKDDPAAKAHINSIFNTKLDHEITAEEMTFLSRLSLERVAWRDPHLLEKFTKKQQTFLFTPRHTVPSDYLEHGDRKMWKSIEDKAFKNYRSRLTHLPPPAVATATAPQSATSTLMPPPFAFSLPATEAQEQESGGPRLWDSRKN